MRIEFSYIRGKTSNRDGCTGLINTCKAHTKRFYLRFFFLIFDIKLTLLNIIFSKCTKRIFIIYRLSLLTKYSFLFLASTTDKLYHLNMIIIVRYIKFYISDINILNIFFNCDNSSRNMFHFNYLINFIIYKYHVIF